MPSQFLRDISKAACLSGVHLPLGDTMLDMEEMILALSFFIASFDSKWWNFDLHQSLA
jgi:hypothetical protein